MDQEQTTFQVDTSAIPPHVFDKISTLPMPPTLTLDMPLDDWKKELQTFFHIMHRISLSWYSDVLASLEQSIKTNPTRDHLYRRSTSLRIENLKIPGKIYSTGSCRFLRFLALCGTLSVLIFVCFPIVYLYFYGRKREEAVVDLEKCIAMDETDHWSLYVLGCCYRSTKKPLKAIECFTKAIESSNHTIAKYYVRRGLSYSDMKNNELALQDFATALEVKPDYPKAFNARGIVRGDMKEHDLALKDFESALALRPNYFKSYLNRANVFADLNRVDEAIRDYTKGIELQPRFFKAYSNRGHLYHEMNNWETALVDFQCALYIDPDYVNSLYNLGILYMDMDRLDDALRCFQRATQIDPSDADCWAYVADIYFSKRDYVKSVENFSKSLEYDRSRRTLYNRGLACYYQGWYEQAIEDINSYFDQENDLPADEALAEHMALFVRGSSFLALGHAAEALADFDKGSKSDSIQPSRRWTSKKAACQYLLGNLNECLSEIHQWCDVWALPDSSEIVQEWILQGEMPELVQVEENEVEAT